MKRNNRWQNILIYVTAFTTSALVMGLEILSNKVIAPYFGSDVYTWGNLIGTFLVAMSLGYYVGGRGADRTTRISTLGWPLVIAGLWTIMVPWLSPLVCPWFIFKMPFEYGSLIAAFILFLPAVFLMAMIFPMSLKLSARSLSTLGKSGGSLYGISSVGSCAGVFLTLTILLNLEILGTKKILIVFGILLFALGTFLFFVPDKNKKSKSAGTVVAILILDLISVSGAFYFWNLRLPPPFPHDKIVFEEESPYHTLRVVDRPTEWGQTRNLMFAGENIIQSGFLLDRPDHPTTAGYTNMWCLAWLYHPSMENMVLIGAGGDTAARDFFRWLPPQTRPQLHLDVVDVDPATFDVSRKYFGFDENQGNVRSFVMDGRYFLKTSPKKYDAVVVDAFSYMARIPEHMTTREFFDEIKGHLSGDGILLFHLNGAVENPPGPIWHRYGKRMALMRPRANAYLSVLKTLRDVFGQERVFTYAYGKADPVAWQKDGSYLSTALALIAVNGDGPIRPDEKGLAARLPNFRDTFDHKTLENFVGSLWVPPGPENAFFKKQYAQAPLLTDDFNPIEFLSAHL